MQLRIAEKPDRCKQLSVNGGVAIKSYCGDCVYRVSWWSTWLLLNKAEIGNQSCLGRMDRHPKVHHCMCASAVSTPLTHALCNSKPPLFDNGPSHSAKSLPKQPPYIPYYSNVVSIFVLRIVPAMLSNALGQHLRCITRRLSSQRSLLQSTR